MKRVCGFVPEQIPVRAGVIQPLKALVSALTKRKRDCAVGVFLPYRAYDIAHHVVGIVRVLAALQNKGAEAEPVTVFTAGEYLLLAEAVAHGVFV